MFTEKLRSLLKFGEYSTRFKDIFDMYYLSDYIDKDILKNYLNSYIINDSETNQNNMNEIISRVNSIFTSKEYMRRLLSSNRNWLNVKTEVVTKKLLEYLKTI